MSDDIGATVDSINYHVKKLKKSGIIEHCGSTKNGYWKINEDIK